MNSVKKVCFKTDQFEGTHMRKDDYPADVKRYDHVSQWAVDKIAKYYKKGETSIFLEGYAYGASAGLVFNIAENGGLLKYKLYKEFDIIPTLFAPTSVKKFYTGSGRAGKDDMIHKLKELEGVDILKLLAIDKPRSPAHDIVDSYAIGLMGKDSMK